MKKATIKDVAQKACVSTALVSRVMNAPLRSDGTPDCVVHPETAKRIFKAIVELGYHPNKAAVSLRKTLKKRIGVIIPNISNPFFADVARHIEYLARKQGYIVLFGSTDDNAEQLGTVAEAFMEDGVDGIIITPGVDCRDGIARVVAQGVPVVLTIRDVPGLTGVGRVLDDDCAATDLAIAHLLSQGFNKIDMISTSHRISNAQHREELFAAKMGHLGLEYKIHHENPNSGHEDIRLILENALLRNVQALYCASASIPIRLLEVTREMGIRIPEDIAVLGYDGGTNYALLSPSISQIEFSREEIAKEAFDALIEMISAPERKKEIRMITPSLIAGDSTSKNRSLCRAEESMQSEKIISALTQASLAIKNVLSYYGKNES